MNKKIYTLMALGILLFAAACSDNASPVSGSTSIPNMGNNLNVPQSPVLCSVMGVTDSLEALEKGCIWSPEMWGPTTGYRVRTGYDNGTNTSGIWTVSTFPQENAYVEMEWPGNATTEYDSMALADVIDKCGGSLCGKILFKGGDNIPASDFHPNTRREVYFDFYLAGKNASGKIESVDARDMDGICVAFSGPFYKLQLVPDDSLAALMAPAVFDFYLEGMPSKTDPNVRENCYPRNAFTLNINYGRNPNYVYPSVEEIWAHLKGFRFVLDGYFSVGGDYEPEFKIVGVSRYNTPRVSTDNLHPVRTDCEPVSVASSFCECDYSDDRVEIMKGYAVLDSLLSKYPMNGDVYASLSDPVKACVDSTIQSRAPYFSQMLSFMRNRKPCDNPLPEYIKCTDGSVSESVEYMEVKTEFDDKVATQDARAIADSLSNYCLSL